MINQVQFLGLKEACKFRADFPTYVISVVNSGDRPANLRRAEFLGILRLEFDDVNESMVGLDTERIPDLVTGHEYGRKIIVNGNEFFDFDHAMKIFAFTERIAEKAELFNVMVHCEVGASRSAAIAKFIHRYYGADLKIGRFDGSQANKRVTRLLEKVSNGISPSVGELPDGYLDMRKLSL